jgi:putative oxidoreductase
VRRLFSTFARGWPGVGLLLLRLVVGSYLVVQGVSGLKTGPRAELVLLNILATGDGMLLIAGLWTPIAASLLVILAFWSSLAHSGNPCPCLLLAAIGAALALVGPGGWSVDAWLFGWKRIDIRS